MLKRNSKKLTLAKNTIATLSAKDLTQVEGGGLPNTRQTHCGTECEATYNCSGQV